MTSMPRSDAPTGGRVTVDLAALVYNWRTVATAVTGAETAAVVKADAYGTGIAAAGAALADAGCRTFFVALPAEGAALRPFAPGATIYVLDGYLPGAGPVYQAHGLSAVLGAMDEIGAWLADGRPGRAPAIHVDTGMNRLGLELPAARALAEDTARLDAIGPSLLVSHFACSETPDHPMNRAQAALFEDLRRLFPRLPGSLANSGGVGLGRHVHHDLVRPGIALYGGDAGPRAPAGLRPVVTVEARVLAVRSVPAGGTVGYGATATVLRDSRVAIVACGYADGYPRRLGMVGAAVAFAGRTAPLVGRVSMDLLAVDVTDLPEGTVRRGDMAELIGPAVPLSEVASAAGTIDYEILTGIGRRCERVYRS